MPSEKTEKKKSETTSEYVTTIRSDIQPAIGANIFRLIYPDKAPELYFKVKRAYTLDDGETFKHTDLMFGDNAEAMAEAAQLAGAWIKKNPEAATGPLPAAENGQARFQTAGPTQPQ